MTSSTYRGTAWAPPRSNALVLHDLVAEAAVVGTFRDIKGQGIYAYVTLNAGVEPSDEVAAALSSAGAQGNRPDRDARPHIHLTPGLPKTRSGKIMRRILRKIAENDFGSLGDTSTLADPGLVDGLIEGERTGKPQNGETSLARRPCLRRAPRDQK
jgi:acetyl-CoA synthetase